MEDLAFFDLGRGAAEVFVRGEVGLNEFEASFSGFKKEGEGVNPSVLKRDKIIELLWMGGIREA